MPLRQRPGVQRERDREPVLDREPDRELEADLDRGLLVREVEREPDLLAVFRREEVVRVRGFEVLPLRDVLRPREDAALRVERFLVPELALDRERDFDAPPSRCSFVRPSLLRCLLTVRAAISLARFVEVPRFFALSLMCSYWRSSLFDHAVGIGFLLALRRGASDVAGRARARGVGSACRHRRGVRRRC